MALCWLYGDYVFLVVVKPEYLSFKSNLTLKAKVNSPQNNRDHNQVILHLWSKFGDSSLHEW